MIKQAVILFLFILAAQAAGILGSFATVPNIESWYDFLVKPALNPPSWVFGPVWTTLYTLMGIASYLVWKSKGENYRRVLALFFTHLFVNASWSIIFFGEQNIGLALGVIIILDLMLLEIIRRFYKISKIAGVILIPYLLWVLFATYLNASLFFLN
tara:strand:- start:3907 stop:4374 length:468 start_codon:yes stop_codon:yes gene_type:complete